MFLSLDIHGREKSFWDNLHQMIIRLYWNIFGMFIPNLNSIFIDAGLVLWLSLLVFAVVFNLWNQMDKSYIFCLGIGKIRYLPRDSLLLIIFLISIIQLNYILKQCKQGYRFAKTWQNKFETVSLHRLSGTSYEELKTLQLESSVVYQNAIWR